ncbi:MAG: hypothetical protein PUG60_03870 [Lachnospiraceae bacterium]|nr:hypothetical protein [Lachnospiraceae bacterium]
MKRRHKRIIIRIIVLLLLFMATVAVVFVLSRRETPVENVVLNREDAALPVVETKIDNIYMNLMHGYVDDMVGRYMRDTVTPLPEDRKLQLKITADGDEVKRISYEVRSLDTTQLVESTEVDSWSESEAEDGSSELLVTLPIQNLLEMDKEYQLQIILQTKSHEKVVYYTRIVLSDSLQTGDMIGFIQDFHERTMDTSKASGMASYMKTTTDTSGSLGKVTLNSSYSQLLWNHLNPKQQGESRIYLTDINNSIGTFRMESRVSFKDEEGKEHICDVQEIFTVQTSSGYWYMLNYERTANEVLTGDSVEDKQICLGIVEDDSIHVMNSAEGMCQAFVMDGELWLNRRTESGSSALIRVFSFSQDEADVRADYKEHDIKLVSVDDKGDVTFILYGYMNNGNHEGSVGLVFYSYDAGENCLEEVFYLPFDRSYAILKEEIGQLAYVNKQELFYLMLNGRIYAIDFAGKEYMTVVEDVADDALVINNDSSVIAWEEERSNAGALRIQILYLEDGHQNTVTAEDGEYLHAVGFVDEDLVAGKIRQSDYETFCKYTDYPMYALEVIDSKGECAAVYEKDGILITDALMENGSVLLKRSRITGTSLIETSDDALIENVNQVTAEEELLVTGEAADGSRRWYLKTDSGSAGEDFVKVDRISVSDSSYLKISLSGIAEDGMYFAYSRGKLQAVCPTIAEAVALVYDDVGYVTDSSGHYVMRRGYRGYSMLGVSSSKTASSKKERKYVCMQTFAAYEGGTYAESFSDMEEEGLTDVQMLQRGMNTIAYDLTGCSLSQIAYYYIGHDHPIYAMTSEGAVLITGIGNENVYIWNPETGSTAGMPIESAEAMFRAAGNIFISCMEP